MDEAYAKTLEEMKGKQWIYKDTVVEILGYILGTGESGNDVEIYTNKRTIETNLFQLPKVLKSFHPIHKQAQLLAREESKKLTVLDSDVIGEIRETVMAQIRRLKENPNEETIKQSKAINEGINTLTNLARTELEYRRHFERTLRK